MTDRATDGVAAWLAAKEDAMEWETDREGP